MAESGIKLKLDGFDDLLEKIKKAGGTIDQAAETCLRKSAEIMQSELKSEMQNSKVPGDLISRMPPPEIESTKNRITAKVGYKKGDYDPKHPSDAYKAIFINYGTPHRSKHGHVKARGFIQRARKKAKAKIKKQQKETLEKILEDLQ